MDTQELLDELFAHAVRYDRDGDQEMATACLEEAMRLGVLSIRIEQTEEGYQCGNS